MDVLLLTFDSVNFTMMTESKLKEEYDCKIIPTPRVISTSCGLAIVIDKKYLEEMKEKVEELPIARIWHYTKEGKDEKAELIKER